MKTQRTSIKYFLMTALLLFLFSNIVVAQDSFYNEAPMLAEQVANGNLPPVDERMPHNPVLLTPIESVGIYGGSWNVGRVSGDYNFIARLLQYEGLVRWDVNWTKVIPNVAQSVETSDDSRTFTFRLREGMRWSDGAPFTADDILFWYEDVYLVEDLKPTHFVFLNGMEDEFTVTKQDDYTVVFTFDEPFGMFLQNMATMSGSMISLYPKHYLMQFHPRYNPDIDQLIAEAGVATWVELFNLHRDGSITSMHPGTPALFAWVFEAGTVISNDPGTSFEAVRNPYYWKIDPEFNQLPYLDTVNFQVVADTQGVLDLALAGKIDSQDRNVPGSAFTQENMSLGGYGKIQLVNTNSTASAFFFNQTSDDPIKREIFQNRDFRIALSYAINRPQLVDLFGGNVVPTQPMPIEGSVFHNEEYSTQYTEYNPALANEILDNIGYVRGDDGWRVGPDGNRIEIVVNYSADPNNPLLQQIGLEWQEIGIYVTYEWLERPQFDARYSPEKPEFNQYDVLVWGAGGGYDTLLFSTVYLPIPLNYYAPYWGIWYQDPQAPNAVEPPADVKRQFELYDQILATADEAQQTALMTEIIQISAEQFNVIGTVTPPPLYGILRPNFHNVPQFMYSSWTYPNPAPTNTSQYYKDPQS